jgi:hypothetical protein
MPRGGKRSGVPGKAYSNRKDLNGPQAIGNFASSGPYGTGVALHDAQAALPVAGAPAPSLAAPPQSAALPGMPPGAGGPPQAPPGPPPGAFGPLNRPTERPNEPLTNGLASGPGAGPEVMMSNPANTTAASVLQRVALQPAASPEVRALAAVYAMR